MKIKIGDNVLAPEPNENDQWNFGEWVGYVEDIQTDANGIEYAEVSDGDGDIFCIDLNRLILED